MNGKDGNISAKENKSRFTPLTIILLAVLILYCLSLAYLIWWCISSSFKINQVVFDFDPYGFFPAYGRYKNSEATAWEITEAKKEGSLFFYTYRHILETFKWKTQSAFGKASRTVYMWEMYGNSLLYAGGCALAATIVPWILKFGEKEFSASVPGGGRNKENICFRSVCGNVGSDGYGFRERDLFTIK